MAFYSAFLNIHWSGVLTALAWLVPHETAAISVHSVYTIQPCTMSLHAKPHICKVYVCFAVTCHLHFWQNDQGLLGATAVNIKITSRTCRFETCRYLQLPNFKFRLISWERVTYSILFHKAIKVLLLLSLMHAHARARTHTHTETGSQANCEILSTIFQAILVSPTKFRHYVYCL